MKSCGWELENLVPQCKIIRLRLDNVSWRRGQDTSVIEMEGERVRSVSVAERIGGIGAGSGFNAELMA